MMYFLINCTFRSTDFKVAFPIHSITPAYQQMQLYKKTLQDSDLLKLRFLQDSINIKNQEVRIKSQDENALDWIASRTISETKDYPASLSI